MQQGMNKINRKQLLMHHITIVIMRRAYQTQDRVRGNFQGEFKNMFDTQ